MDKVLTWIKSHKYLLTSLLINIILCLCLMSNCKGREPIIETKYIPIHDTITVTLERIVEKTKVKYVNLTDTFYISTKTKDTVFVLVPIEHKEYKDTIKNDSTEAQLEIYYHGAFADLDSVDLKYNYYKEVTTIMLPPKKWNFGITFGPYVGFGGHLNINDGVVTTGYGPEIGIGCMIGLQYNFQNKRRR